MYDEAALEAAIKQVAEIHLPEGMKRLAAQTGASKWFCQCGQPGISTKQEYLNHLAQVQMTVIHRIVRGSDAQSS